MAVKEKSPIFTADGKPVETGMVVYGFDTGCNAQSDPCKYITPLVVAEIDLGAKRMVRLRKADGREWRWYAEESRVSCSNDEHLIYASFAKAKQAAYPVIKKVVESEASEAEDRVEALERQAQEKEQRYRTMLTEHEESKSMSERRARALKESLSAFRKLKSSDLPDVPS